MTPEADWTDDVRPAAPADARTLPARYYVDPAVFALEEERIHRAMWTAVCPSSDLAEPGDYRLVEIAGDSLVVVRGADGAVRAHHNVCRHRGTRLLDCDAGRLPGAIQCPYHAWTYDLGGRLLRAPHMDRVPGFSADDWPLASAACEEWGGIVFVRVADSGPTLLEQLGPAAARVAPYRLESLVSVHTERYDLCANWKLVVQNFSECLHCPVIHPQLQRLSHYLSGDNHPVTPGAVGSTMNLAEGVETLSTDGRLVGEPLPSAPAGRIGYEILLPSVMLCLHPDYAARFLMRALAVNRTEIRCDWLFAGSDIDPSRAVEFWHETNLQDWRVSELAQRGIASSAYRPGPYSNREDQLWAIDRLVLDRLGESG